MATWASLLQSGMQNAEILGWGVEGGRGGAAWGGGGAAWGGGGAAWEDNVVSHDAYMQAWKLNLKHLDDDSQMF